MLFLFIFDYLELQRGDKTASGFNTHGLPPIQKCVDTLINGGLELNDDPSAFLSG